jgi:hypothetical protein
MLFAFEGGGVAKAPDEFRAGDIVVMAVARHYSIGRRSCGLGITGASQVPDVTAVRAEERPVNGLDGPVGGTLGARRLRREAAAVDRLLAVS